MTKHYQYAVPCGTAYVIQESNGVTMWQNRHCEMKTFTNIYKKKKKNKHKTKRHTLTFFFTHRVTWHENVKERKSKRNQGVTHSLPIGWYIPQLQTHLGQLHLERRKIFVVCQIGCCLPFLPVGLPHNPLLSPMWWAVISAVAGGFYTPGHFPVMSIDASSAGVVPSRHANPWVGVFVINGQGLNDAFWANES